MRLKHSRFLHENMAPNAYAPTLFPQGSDQADALGIVLALLSCLGLSALMNLPFLFNPGINLLTLVFSAAIGILFGYMPARRAASLDPIVALRFE